MWKQARDGGVAVRRLGRRAPRPKPTRASPQTCWDEMPTPVEVTAPDHESARALLRDALEHFHAELVETDGAAPVVRLRPARTASTGWVFELLAVVERWLGAHDLQVANVHHGNRSYVIMAAPPGNEWDGGPEPAAA
jgi:hypothetical protein